MSLSDSNFREFIFKELERNRWGEKLADEELSKILLYVSAGAFAVSITFYSGSSCLENIQLLLASWACLSSSLMSNAFSYYISRRYSAENFEEINNRIGAPEEFTPQMYQKLSDDLKDKRGRKIERINDFVMFSFILGLAFLVLFAICNVAANNVQKEVSLSQTSCHQ
ncbi:MAG TPA: hypothetical protein VFA52_01660 [Candidatus Paceibacterota bacterium]|nr:hypothetical protein [Candidatus Paceibacterota bacterium]